MTRLPHDADVLRPTDPVRRPAPPRRRPPHRAPLRRLLATATALAGAGPGAPSASAQSRPSPDADVLASWIAQDLATGYESRVVDAMAEGLPGWSADRWGNLVRTVGSGSPVRVVACALDRPAYAASRITDDGYLRVHRIGRGPDHPLWDQMFEAQQVRVLTAEGPVAGVVARSNGHFGAQHADETEPVTADDLWIDVGATSAAEVAALGIGLLDPVVRHFPPWTMAGHVAGPSAGRAVGCAAVATLAGAAAEGASRGTLRFVMSAQEAFGWVGLASTLARGGSVDEVVVLGPGQGARVDEVRPAARLSRFGDVLESRGVASVAWLAPAVGDPGAHAETVALDEAAWLLGAAAERAGVSLPATPDWVPAPPRAVLRTAHADPAYAALASTLEAFVERHGVPGHEWAVRRLLLESMPAWARERAVVDGIGNVVVEMGPERDTTVFMAHLDEVGYTVASVTDDGVVTLDREGGAVSTAWEGQTALLHFDPPGAPSTLGGNAGDPAPGGTSASLGATAPAPLRGVFLARDEAEERDPATMRAWFGLTGPELRARGVAPGAGVTSHKEGLRMGRHRFVARALDDRAGTTALLTALGRMDPATLDHKVIFAWSVHEEGGLRGAAAMAERFGASARRIYSVDTFVSSDTPLESDHFAYAPLGAGPVLRAIENGGISPDAERDRVRRVAREAGIPLQLGLTQGSTDGSTFTVRGAPNQGLSWPGRYSHSPGEVLDLRDLEHLARLIEALARVP